MATPREAGTMTVLYEPLRQQAQHLAMLVGGDIHTAVSLDEVNTLINHDRDEETGVRTWRSPYCPGVGELRAPVEPAVAEEVTRGLVADIIDLARSMFDYVVIDTPPPFNDVVLAALDASHLYVLVATPDLPALKNLRVTLDMFEMLDYQREHRVVVLNRADARVGLTAADIERVIRVPIVAHVPSSRDVPISVNKGVPIVLDSPGHAVSTAIRELAVGRLAGEVGVQPKRLRGLLRRGGKR